MFVYEKNGEYDPAALAAHLRAAGIDVHGVTCTETDPTAKSPARVVAVQIICGDDTTEKAVDDAIASYSAADPAVAAKASKQSEIATALAATDWWFIREAEGGKKMTAKQKAYRAELRDLHTKTETAKAPAELELPEPPGGAA